MTRARAPQAGGAIWRLPLPLRTLLAALEHGLRAAFRAIALSNCYLLCASLSQGVFGLHGVAVASFLGGKNGRGP